MIGYRKAPPTTYVIQYQDGRIRREGPGLTFFYWLPSSTIVEVPLASADVPFAFSELTGDFQPITLQGQLTYRVVDPRRAAALLDFSTTAAGGYATDDPDTLPERLVQAAQIHTRAVVQRMTLRQALIGSDEIVAAVLPSLQSAPAVAMLGVEVLALVIVAIRATPEMARALEAEAREAIQRESDDAIYARRIAAVEQERRVRESELNTEMAVQEKQRQMREAGMAAEIAVEGQRTLLMETRTANERMDADARAYALRATLEPLRETDWRTLMAAGVGGGDARAVIAMAFRDLADNAGRIGQLNITPDLLQTLLGPGEEG
ncbi:MAG TPA: SPFH domain-containing protein [Longimicrobiales bacterium]|nr:SPFH domain-containing protein [Longimicrobiales bacterium]